MSIKQALISVSDKTGISYRAWDFSSNRYKGFFNLPKSTVPFATFCNWTSCSGISRQYFTILEFGVAVAVTVGDGSGVGVSVGKTAVAVGAGVAMGAGNGVRVEQPKSERAKTKDIQTVILFIKTSVSLRQVSR